MKPRLVLDLGLLGHAHDVQSARRGVQRVTRHLFDGLQKTDELDVSFVASEYLAGSHDFLVAQGIAPEGRLFFKPGQMRASRLTRRFVAHHRAIQSRPGLLARADRRVTAMLANHFARTEVISDPAAFAGADIFHSPQTAFPPVVNGLQGVKKFLTVHDLLPLKHPERYLEDLRPVVNSWLGCLTPENFAFAVSNATRDDALNYSKIRPENIFVTPLAADEDIFYPEPDRAKIAAACGRLGIPEGPYLLSLSAHDPHKNFAHIIRCFGELVESGELTGVNLVIVGPNPDENASVVEALAKFPRAKSRVIVAGFVPDADLAALYSGATAFLFPSLGEGFGIPPLEAMQCGAPVIASNTTSIPEVVGDAGILLPPTDCDAWCQNMLRLTRDEALRAAMREKSLQRCKLFSWERFMAETLRGYRTALERGR